MQEFWLGGGDEILTAIHCCRVCFFPFVLDFSFLALNPLSSWGGGGGGGGHPPYPPFCMKHWLIIHKSFISLGIGWKVEGLEHFMCV